MKEEPNIHDLANMLIGGMTAEMTIKIDRDRIAVSGGTAIKLVDLYIVIRALEATAAACLPMMVSEDSLRECLKNLIDTMDFKED